MFKRSLIIIDCILCFGFFSCRPEMPATSTISIDANGLTPAVNEKLYGLTLEEINHAIDGGLYAELIRNRGFEEGVPPLNCPYIAATNSLITPNGYSIPFMRSDSMPGWKCYKGNTLTGYDAYDPVSEKSTRALAVAAKGSAVTGPAGIMATGYNGIPIVAGKQYVLSFYTKSSTAYLPKEIRIALRDSLGKEALSDVMTVHPINVWHRYRHTFTANATTDRAVLAFSSDTTVNFWLDAVSLFPQETWRSESNGLRKDLMEMVALLQPRFIRFPGGAFAEGYTAGTYPEYDETIGDPVSRRNFWNIWSYGSTNGMGFLEYLRLCEDLQADPVYVINSGVTNQLRRPRYEDITAMDQIANRAIDAISYANSPVSTPLGALRSKHGHPEPFELRYIQIGSENWGHEYYRRYIVLHDSLKSRYPTVRLISSTPLQFIGQSDLADSHYYADGDFFVSNYDRFIRERRQKRMPNMMIGEFGMVDPDRGSTLQAAVDCACFLCGVEKTPEVVKNISYSPVLGNVNYQIRRAPMILFNNHQAYGTPMYYMYRLFAMNRGSELLHTTVNSYNRPFVTYGRCGIYLFDNSFDFKDVSVNNRSVTRVAVMQGSWERESNRFIPEANKWNHILFGDTTDYNGDYRISVTRTKGSGVFEMRLRDNGRQGEQANYYAVTIGAENITLEHQSGNVRDRLASVPFAFESHRTFVVRAVAANDLLTVYIDGKEYIRCKLISKPSIVSVATVDRVHRQLILKVVNTTMHNEITHLNFSGISVGNRVRVAQLSGQPDDRNSFDRPDRLKPVQKEYSFPLARAMSYTFPPCSITILTFNVE